MHYHDAMKTIPKAHLKELQNCIFCIITTWSLFYLIPIYISLYFLLFLWKKNFSPLSGLMCVLFWTPFRIHKPIAFVFFINSTELWSKDVFMILRNMFSLHQANKKHQFQIYVINFVKSKYFFISLLLVHLAAMLDEIIQKVVFGTLVKEC